MKLLVITLSTLFFYSPIYAKTVIFTDSQFTASNYGQRVAKTCLNPDTFSDSQKVNFFAAPGANPQHLLSRKRNMAHVYTFSGLSGKRSTYHKRTRSKYPVDFFNNNLDSTEVKRVMIFMGVNNLSSSGVISLKQVGDKIAARGKDCVIGLVPLVDRSQLNRKIREFNNKVKKEFAGHQCKLADISNTTNGKEEIKFKTSDGVHFSSKARVSQAVADATCVAVKEALKGGEERQTQATLDTPAPTVKPAMAAKTRVETGIPVRVGSQMTTDFFEKEVVTQDEFVTGASR